MANPKTGTITATGSDNGVTSDTLDGYGPAAMGVVVVSGTYTSPTLVVEKKLRGGSVWVPVLMQDEKTMARSNGSAALTTDTTYSFRVDLGGASQFRAYCSGGSGLTMAVELHSGATQDFGGILPAAYTTTTGAAAYNDAVTSNSATAGIGYATGAGGAVMQITSRTTGVTLNKVCGAITLVSAAGSTTAASFTVTNSTVAATDVVSICQKSGTDLYRLHVTNVQAGSFQVTSNTVSGTTTEQPVFSFVVHKAVAA